MEPEELVWWKSHGWKSYYTASNFVAKGSEINITLFTGTGTVPYQRKFVTVYGTVPTVSKLNLMYGNRLDPETYSDWDEDVPK